MSPARPYPKLRMVCAVCHRPMMRAAALLGGLPVGPVCAASQGLLPFGRCAGAGAGAPRAKAQDTAAVVRDTLTADLFGGV